MLIKKLNQSGQEAAGNVAAGLIVVFGMIAWVNHDPLSPWVWQVMIGAAFFCLSGVFGCILTRWGLQWRWGVFSAVNLLIAFLGVILGGLGWGL